jgi:AraC family transcriptional activator of mtrCDE
MLSRRKTYAGRIKHPDDATEPATHDLARHRLGSTTGTLAQVAAAVGYDSESAFVRAFRKRYGISPGRLRARHEGRSRVRNDIQSASDAQT